MRSRLTLTGAPGAALLVSRPEGGGAHAQAARDGAAFGASLEMLATDCQLIPAVPTAPCCGGRVAGRCGAAVALAARQPGDERLHAPAGRRKNVAGRGGAGAAPHSFPVRRCPALLLLTLMLLAAWPFTQSPGSSRQPCSWPLALRTRFRGVLPDFSDPESLVVRRRRQVWSQAGALAAALAAGSSTSLVCLPSCSDAARFAPDLAHVAAALAGGARCGQFVILPVLRIVEVGCCSCYSRSDITHVTPCHKSDPGPPVVAHSQGKGRGRATTDSVACYKWRRLLPRLSLTLLPVSSPAGLPRWAALHPSLLNRRTHHTTAPAGRCCGAPRACHGQPVCAGLRGGRRLWCVPQQWLQLRHRAWADGSALACTLHPEMSPAGPCSSHPCSHSCAATAGGQLPAAAVPTFGRMILPIAHSQPAPPAAGGGVLIHLWLPADQAEELAAAAEGAAAPDA